MPDDNLIHFPTPEKLEPKFDHDGPFRANHDRMVIDCMNCGQRLNLDELFKFLIQEQLKISEIITDCQRFMQANE